MRKLQDIPKKSIFQVPEKYFDELPATIQARIAQTPSREDRPIWRYAVQYALPLLIAGLILYYYYPARPDAAAILSSVESADLVQYLQQETALTTDDIIENVEFTPADVQAIEDQAYELPIDGPNSQDIELELNTL